MHIGTTQSANARAILVMVAAMASFAGVDAYVKLASRTQSSGQILALTSISIFLIFWVILRINGEKLLTRQALNPALLIRSLGEAAGSSGIIIALGLVPLSTVTVLGQALPLAVTLGAAVFLGEKVGLRRWTAIGLGFCGVLFILRPGAESFDPNALWLLLYVGGLTARDLASRVLPKSISIPFAVAWAMAGLILIGAVMMPHQGGWNPINWITAYYLMGAVVCAAAGMALITASLRLGEISAVAPFRYSRIVIGLFVAYLVFDEVPDGYTWVGAALIVGSGLYAFLRERRHATAKP